jgi:hypothetical protein
MHVRWWSTTQEHDAQLTAELKQKVDEYGSDNVLLVGLRSIPQNRAAAFATSAGVAGLADVRMARRGPFLATTSSVKGLEAVAVIVYGVDDLSSQWARRFLYASCSRALVDLTVFLHRSTKEDFDESGRWFGKQLAEIIARRRPE